LFAAHLLAWVPHSRPTLLTLLLKLILRVAVTQDEIGYAQPLPNSAATDAVKTARACPMSLGRIVFAISSMAAP
jgi:hypothetical protein